MITPYGYSPTSEGFSGANADVLRVCNKTAIGYKNGKVYLMVIPNIGHGALLKLFQEMDLDLVITLDGGGSTCMKFNGKTVISSARVVNNWVTVKEN
jgi:exopolysaccharide biosynthesis protein